MSQLSLKEISFYREKIKTIDSVSLDVESGEIVSLVGPSGCGKSTLLKLVLGIEKVSQGEIFLGDNVLSSAKKHVAINHRDMGVVFQSPSLFPHMTIEKNVLFGLHKLSTQEQEDRLVRYLNMVGLLHVRDQYPHQLSGGEQQRIALIRSLIVQPSLLLLDEPFANLDSVIRRRLREDIVSILKQSKMTAIFVTHDPLEAMEIADRIIVMREGALVQQGTPQEVYTHPVDYECASFFGGLNHLITINGTDEGYIRPERMTISTQPSKHALEGEVEQVIFAGHDSMVCVKSAGLLEIVRVHISDGLSIKQGERVYVDWSPDNIMRFD